MGDFAESEKIVVAQADIVRGLREVGVRPGDVVFAHSSLKSFGRVAGGADAVIDAMLEAVGPAGTLVVPTFTWGSFHDKADAVFDMVCTPSEVGYITEVFRKRPEAIRSPHLCHSVAAIGKHAREVMGYGAPTAFCEGSTFDALLKLDAWNLFLGVSFECCTALHAAEERMKVPYRYFRQYARCSVVWPDGTRKPCDSREFLRQEGYRNDLAKMGEVFARVGVLRTTKVGGAAITNVRIRDVIEIAERNLREDIHFLLRDDGRPTRM